MAGLSLLFVANGSSILTNSELLVTATGGSLTSANQTINSSTGYGQIAFGAVASWAGAGSMGAQDGNGATYDVSQSGNTLAGSWTATIPMFTSQSGKTTTGTMILRASKYNSSTHVYTTITSISQSVTLTSTSTPIVFSSSSFPSTTFATNEYLYFDCWYNITANTMTSGGQIGYSFSSSSTLGNTGSEIVYTAGATINSGSITESNPATETIKAAIATTATENNPAVESGKANIASTISETNVITEASSSSMVSLGSITESNPTTESTAAAVASSAVEINKVVETQAIIIRSSISETNKITESAVGVSLPVSSSSDPDAQMLNDDLLLEYSVLRMATLTTPIARIFIVRYPPAKVLSVHSIPGELDVLLVGEDYSQVHRLKTINQVSAFITAYS